MRTRRALMRFGSIGLGSLGTGLLLAVLLLPGGARAACQYGDTGGGAQALTAKVSGVDVELRKLQLGQWTFWVADDTAGLTTLEPGAIVRVHHECQGDRDTVVKIELRVPAPAATEETE
jgi:hypothetical protein